jgi:hypothetical protein
VPAGRSVIGWNCFAAHLVGFVQQLKHSRDISLQLRSYEALALALQPPLMKHVLPVDASVEDIAVDADLRFLDGYVRQALDMGARQYPPGAYPCCTPTRHASAPADPLACHRNPRRCGPFRDSRFIVQSPAGPSLATPSLCCAFDCLVHRPA